MNRAAGSPRLPAFLYQLRMPFNSLFYSLRLNANVSLRDACAAVLQEPLDQRNVIAVVSVNLCCVPFAEAVRADALIAQIIANSRKDLLNFSCGDGEDQVGVLDAVAQTVILNVLLDNKGNSKHSLFACLLFHDGQAEASAVADNIAGAELYGTGDGSLSHFFLTNPAS